MDEIPPAIRAHLEKTVRSVWSGRDTPAPRVPDSLPEGVVSSIVRGGPFGWLLDARIDRVDGRLVLEVLEDSRMAGPNRYRVWEDGTVEPLPTEHGALSFPPGASPEEQERLRRELDERNRAVAEELRERGFAR